MGKKPRIEKDPEEQMLLWENDGVITYSRAEKSRMPPTHNLVRMIACARIAVPKSKVRLSAGRTLVLEKVAASRPWLQHLLEDMVVDKPLAVPSVVLLAL